MKSILSLSNGNLVYRTVGKPHAETIFFCHSLGANQSLWDRQIEQLSDSYHIVSCDLRGHGESDIFTTPYSIEILAKDNKLPLGQREKEAARLAQEEFERRQ